jgi:hypothetical protein
MSGPWLRLSRAAWLAAGTHIVAGLAMLLVLRHGLETAPSLEARLRFIAEHTPLWTAGWLTWNAAALSILYFCVAFAAAHSADRERAPLWFAVALCAAAVACDLGAESVFMGVLVELSRPSLDELSRGVPGAASRFVLWQRSAVMLTGYVANGLYSAAILVLWWLTRSAYGRLEVAAGLVLCLAGFALSAAALAGSVAGMFWANVVLLPSLLVWLAAVARHASGRARSGETA